jgi:hypothetical protein
MGPRAKRRTQSKRRWSGEVNKHSHALDLDQGVFTWSRPRKIASSLKRSAETSTQRKAKPYQSAMSMLNFYLNRAGGGLTARQKKVLERAKDELRKLFGREPR